MKRVLTLVAGAVLVSALLAACSQPPAATQLRFSLADDGVLGYEIDDEGVIIIESRSMRFWNPPGAVGLTVLQYRIAYFDQFGVPFGGVVEEPEEPTGGAVTASNGFIQTGPVGIFVPPGIQCAAPDVVLGCTLGAAGSRFAPGPSVTTQGFQLLSGAVAIAHVFNGFPVGWYAEMEFDVVDSTGRAWTTAPYRVTITVPN